MICLKNKTSSLKTPKFITLVAGILFFTLVECVSAQSPMPEQQPLVVQFDQHSAMGVVTNRKKGFPGMWEEDEIQVQNTLVNPTRKLSPEVNVNDLEPTSPEQD